MEKVIFLKCSRQAIESLRNPLNPYDRSRPVVDQSSRPCDIDENYLSHFTTLANT